MSLLHPMNNVIEKASSVPAWTEISERELLSKLSREVPVNGLIVEIGCLYGGTTAVLALSNPDAKVISIDNFSWTPEGYQKTSKELAENNLSELGISNVKVKEGDSRRLGRTWNEPIDFLWIDGGHSYQFVYSDLYLFGLHAKVIALHDYDNPAWASIRQAVETFIGKFPYWYVDEVVGMVCVLRRK